jgi:glutamate dehydrogenase
MLAPAGDIVNLARAADVDIERAARTYFAIGNRFGFNWLRGAVAGLPSDTAWDKLAVGAVVDDLDATQAELAGKVLECDGSDYAVALEEWCAPRGPLVLRNEQLMTELQSMQIPNLAMLTVAARQLKSMAL